MDNPIKKWFEKSGMTQAAFAEAVGVQYQTAHSWLHDQNTNMNASNLVKVQQFTKIPLKELAAWAAHKQLVAEGYFADDREAG